MKRNLKRPREEEILPVPPAHLSEDNVDWGEEDSDEESESVMSQVEDDSSGLEELLPRGSARLGQESVEDRDRLTQLEEVNKQLQGAIAAQAKMIEQLMASPEETRKHIDIASTDTISNDIEDPHRTPVPEQTSDKGLHQSVTLDLEALVKLLKPEKDYERDVRPPDYLKFDGKAQHLRGFLQDCDDYIRITPKSLNTDEKKIIFVGSLLDGGAKDWYRQYRELDHEVRPEFMRNYALFREELERTWSDPDREAAAERTFLELSQRNGAAAAYSTTFRQYMAILGYTEMDKPLVALYYSGLKAKSRTRSDEKAVPKSWEL